MLFGPDVSNYQPKIDMARVRRDGCEFVSAKATQGTSYRSPSYPRQRDDALAAGLVFWAYHYVTTDDADAQARNFLSWVGNRDIPVMLDWEDGSGDGANLRRVAAAFTRAGARVALIYAPRWYWQKVGSPSLAGLPPLVASSYPSTRSADEVELYRSVTAKRWEGYGGNSVALLQFSDRAAIAGLAIDVNAYPGTREQLVSLLYGTPTAAPAADSITEELVSGQTYWNQAQADRGVSQSNSIQVEAECGAGSAAFEKAWIAVMIPDGVLDVTVYPRRDMGKGKQPVYASTQRDRLDKAGGYQRAVFGMPADNTDACVQWTGGSQPVTVTTIHTPKKG